MNKEEYKKSLHRHYPEEPDNVLELAWHFHGMEKAKKYTLIPQHYYKIFFLST